MKLLKKLGFGQQGAEPIIIEAVNTLIKKEREALEQFETWRKKRGLSKRRLAMLLAVARDWRIMGMASQMPPDLETLHILTGARSIVIDECLTQGLISGDMTREQARMIKAV